MSNEEKFYFDVDNLKKDLAMENMTVTDEDVQLLKRYFNSEITMPEMIDIIKKSVN